MNPYGQISRVDQTRNEPRTTWYDLVLRRPTEWTEQVPKTTSTTKEGGSGSKVPRPWRKVLHALEQSPTPLEQSATPLEQSSMPFGAKYHTHFSGTQLTPAVMWGGGIRVRAVGIS
eukprot:gene16510-biopygen20291